MRIDWLWIGEYKNLKDLTIDFAEEHLITVLIGRNGTGKSNVLEAITVLFRDLIMGEDAKGNKNKPSFAYRISYQIKDKWVRIDADPENKEPYRIKLAPYAHDAEPAPVALSFDEAPGEALAVSRLRDEEVGYLPKFLFGYYSGQSERMEEVFHKYLERYDKDLRAGKNPGLKRLFYALPVHSNFVLLSFIVNNAELTDNFLQEQLGLEEGGIDSVLFVLRKPSWTSKGGDPRFWNARGVVSEFLATLYDISIAPLRITRKEKVSLWNSKTMEFLYLFVKDLDALRKLRAGKSTAQFFQDLESTYVSELIDEVRIRVKLRKNDGSVTFRELSEGEQQLLTVLGLLRFTAEEESLFLLDEPDTHLNPRWSVEYLQHIRNFLNVNEGEKQSSHVLLATHNPVAVAELEKEQVQILTRDRETLTISAAEPDTHPRGMGYAGVMTSEMFGLSAALDTHTQDLLARKRRISAKDELDQDDRKELKEINDELQTYGFRYEVRDPELKEALRKLNHEPHPTNDREETPEDSKKAERLINQALQKEGD
ncbi:MULTISPECIES: ATP-binding protein [Thalassospira]|uniref:AAA family ATPase n=1 Tax=Thalassospira TaxID=168934 RepID=UPI0008DD163E|nr:MULTISPECIES: ATP-binding protein [Thalassospira]MCD1594486.1 AAA family ATPase [Thalassospira xiamenensis]MDM7978205.1 AAA family ATPase [Thalassospira xiamenensis]OHY98984.1 chromosome segregation protein SMC [Thalassospira sp. MIT1004]|tara:strand:+ start:4294 stop:5913 length:1620 start_codon:yes stop_codon:yes gene_type:complete